MPLELHELSHDSEFPGLVDALWRGYAEPFNGFWEILKGPSLEECAERYRTWHRADPTSHWLYVTDSETKKVVGAMQWNIFETNPYSNGEAPSLAAYWWPEGMKDLSPILWLHSYFGSLILSTRHKRTGSFKEISNQLLECFVSGRPSRFAQPHICKQ